MKCFTHSGSDAVGFCKFCAKGLCHSCCRDEGLGLFCSDSCGEKVVITNKISEVARKTYGIGEPRKRFPIASLMFSFMGISFILLGLNANPGLKDPTGWLFMAMGAGFIAFGLTIWWRNKQAGANL